MSRYDLVIRGGTLVLESGPVVSDLAVSEGHITEISPEIAGSAAEEVDAAGLHVLPGAIDAHVHFDEPGRTEWEGFATGSRALAAGGATSFVEMPLNAYPPTTDARRLEAKRRAAERSSVLDFALWGGLVPGNLGEMAALAEGGVAGFKAFMSATGTDDFRRADDLTLFEGMRRAAELGLPVAVHAENEEITSLLSRRAVAEGRVGARDYLAARPVIAEYEAIQRAILLAEEAGCALHVVHVSTGRGVALVAEARARGADVTCETCPHYLVLTGEDLERLGSVAKCAPPLRAREDQAELWRRLEADEVDLVASDHSPCPPGLKDEADLFRAWGGISGCQSLLPLMLDAGYHGRKLPLTSLARLLASGSADRFGLSPRKGRIEAGADADLALVDLEEAYTLEAGDLRYRHRMSPFVGRKTRGRVVRTISRGRTVFRAGVRDARPGGGRMLVPHHIEEETA